MANTRRSLLVRAGSFLPLLLAGCAGIGPQTLRGDRMGYVAALSDSWKQQMLLNLLKVRYGDLPVFLDVTSIINSYSVEQDVRIAAQAAPVNRGDTFFGAAGGSRYSDHPTITYVPLMGDKFARGIMSPIPVPAVLLLLQSGYPADLVLRLCVHAANGLGNARGGVSPRPADPGFEELLALLRAEQVAGNLGFEARAEGGRTRNLLLLRAPADADTRARQARIRALLGLPEEPREFEVGHGSFPAGSTQLAIVSRSMLQVMIDASLHIETPGNDVAEGRVTARAPGASDAPMRVRVSSAPPDDAFVAVAYRGHWFWISDREYASKSAFSFLMLLFSLTETAPSQGAPLVTVPAR